MRVNGGSDLARLQALQKQAFDTRNKLDVAAQELSTNLKANRFEATGGNLTRLFALERSLDRNAVFSQNIALMELRLDVMQESLGRILTPAEDMAIDLSESVNRGDYATSMLHATAARRDFAATVAGNDIVLTEDYCVVSYDAANVTADFASACNDDKGTACEFAFQVELKMTSIAAVGSSLMRSSPSAKASVRRAVA